MVSPNNATARLREALAIAAAPSAGITRTVGGIGVPPRPQFSGGLTKERSELERARVNAARRILSDPIARQNSPQKLIADLDRIAKGEKKDSGGLFGFLGDVGEAAFGGAMYALSRPLALVTSIGKEISDIPSGGFSFEDLAKQALAKDTAPSKYLPKSGVKWLDTAIGFTADVALDPLTWVIPGAKAFSGRHGRIGLAAKAAEAGNIAKAPTLAAKVADGRIAKYGEWALDDFEREVLGVQKGMSWLIGGKTIGKPGTALGKVSGASAELFGKNFAKARAAVGSSKLLRPVQEITNLGSLRASDLGQYGRAGFDATPEQVFSRLAVYSSSMRGKSGGRLFGAKVAQKHFDATTQAAKHERNGGNSLIDIIEGTVDPSVGITQADLDAARAFTEHMEFLRTSANDVAQEVTTRRGNRIIDIAHRANYVPHVLTEKAREVIWKLKKTDPKYKNVVELLDIPSEDFLRSPGPLRARKVKVGDKFLGQEVQPIGGQVVGDSATIREMNRISNDVLGVDWFETDAAAYMNSYLQSIQNQVARVKFMDRMYDYGTDVVDSYATKIVPDRKVIKHWRNSEKFFNGMIKGVRQGLYGNVTDARAVAAQQLRLAEKVMNGKANEIVFTKNQIGRIRRGIQSAREELAIAEEAARARGGEIEEAFEIAVAPYRARIQAIDDALAGNRADEMLAQIELEDMYRKTFPTAKRMPEDPMELAEKILTRTQSTTGSKLRAAETKKKRLESTLRKARGKVGRREQRAIQADKQIRAEIEQLDKEIADLQEAFSRSDQTFPEGYVFVRKGDVISSAERSKTGFPEEAVLGDPTWRSGTPEMTPEEIAADEAKQMAEWGFVEPRTPPSDELSRLGYTTSPGSDYVVTRGGVEVYTSIPPGEPMSNFDIYYAPTGAMQGEPGLGAKVLRPLESGEDFLDFVDVVGFGIGKAINDIGDRQTAEAFAEQWDEILKSSKGGGRALDPSFAAAEPELAGILARADRIARRNFDNMSGEELTSLLDDDMDAIATMLDGYLARIADEPGVPPEVLEMDGIEVLRYAVGQAGDPGFGFSEIVGIDLGDLPIFGGTGVVMNSGYLARTLEPVPRQSSIYRQAYRGGVDVTGELMARQETGRVARSMQETVTEELQQATELAKAKRAEKGNVGRSISATKRAQAAREEKLGGLTGRVEKARNEVIIGGPEGPENIGTMMQAEEAIAQAEGAISTEQRKLQVAIDTDPYLKTAKRKADAVKVAEARLDAPQALLGEQEEWMRTTGALYQNEIDAVRQLVETMPKQSDAREVTMAWLDSVDRTLASLESAPLDAGSKMALERVIKQARGLEADLAMYESLRDLASMNLEKAMTGELQGKVVNDLKKGWSAISSMGVQVNPEVQRLLTQTIDRFSDPKEWSKFKKMWTGYNTFFKVSAMFTPGFIVRNGYTAAFNNFVAGVSLGESREGIRFIRNVRKNGLQNALDSLPENMRQMYEDSYQAVLGSGSGQTMDEILQPLMNRKARRILDSAPLRKWANANQATEEAARFALALSGAKRGLALDENIAQISRYHFNYSDLSKLDDWAKMVVPFWIFATRNIPLQIVNQIARPSMYRSYEKLQENAPTPEGAILPPWMSRRQPLGLPWDPNAVINPDLPQLDMREQIQMFADPQRLVSQATPLIRLPVELMGNRQLALDIPFKDKPQEVRGPLDYPAYALMRLGLWGNQAGEDPTTGKPWVSQKASYALGNLIPTLSTIQRNFPELGGKENYLDRVGSSRWNTLGIPYRRFSPEEQADELTRREFAMKDYLSRLTRTGYLKPKGQ